MQHKTCKQLHARLRARNAILAQLELLRLEAENYAQRMDDWQHNADVEAEIEELERALRVR